jgi:hypothetical protein
MSAPTDGIGGPTIIEAVDVAAPIAVERCTVYRASADAIDVEGI